MRVGFGGEGEDGEFFSGVLAIGLSGPGLVRTFFASGGYPALGQLLEITCSGCFSNHT